VRIDAPTHVTPRSEFIARIAVEGLTDFDASSYDVVYDPAVFSIIGDEGSADGVSAGSVGATDIPVDLWGFVPAGTPGRIRVIQNVPGVAEVGGSGILAEIRFQVIGEPGLSSAIMLKNGCLGNEEAQRIPAAWIGTSVLFRSAGATTPSPSPSAAPPSPLATSGHAVPDNARVPLALVAVTLGAVVVVAGSIIIGRALWGR
jgi:hypothetical protein